MIVEMREYRLKPGMRSKILSIFPTKLFPECKRIGMKVAGPWVSVEDDVTLFWMRGFPNEGARGTMSSQFYGGSVWQNELADVFMPALEKYEVVAVEMPEDAVKWV